MKRNLTHRPAIAALFAAVAFSTAPVFAQDAPAAAPPPPIVDVTPPPIVTTPPPAPVTAAPPPVLRPAPVIVRTAPPPAAAERPAARTARATPPRAAARPRVQAPVRRAAPAPAPAPVVEAAPAPAAVAPAPIAAAPAAPPPALVPVEPAPVETGTAGGSILPWILAGAALLIAAFGLLAWRRRRATADEYYEEEVDYEEPVAVAAAEPSFARPDPVVPAAAPAAAAALHADEVEVGEPAQADVDALAATSEPVAGRPWLEFLMRPVRAGTSRDDAIVQFELTVGNTGSVEARDVRISTWMVAAGQGSDTERMLIEPPADASVSEVDIAAGDGARVEGEIALSKAGLGDETVLPVVVADARYRLPDGSEGRTHASFAIGLPDGDDLVPFQLDRASGLIENVEARLHGEPERV